MNVYVLGSGSSGNCIVIDAGGARIVLDAGLNPTAATRRIRSLGSELAGAAGASYHGVFVTHHHADHVAHAVPLSRALRVPLFIHEGVVSHHLVPLSKLDADGKLQTYTSTRSTVIGPFTVEALPLPHDAPQMALKVSARVNDTVFMFGLVTDLGHVPDALAAFLSDCDGILLESNHCPKMMAFSSYPETLRQRILGPDGHLSNEQTAELVARLPRHRLRRIVFGHLSRVANTPERAKEALAGACGTLAFDVLDRDTAALLDLASGTFAVAPPG